ncbi:hypothetical protein FA95DRAFT_1578555 [Auriscalpium vulgare]|uniref:Uncharacterized protein n=1 Tax=Auriscalpium vulgare TaxID=40419 RepID=A0ACB8R227_9AGAM|nr:hypothetical protein FA95DRAFT_1578555 [Auriscalpium vulgare]
MPTARILLADVWCTTALSSNGNNIVAIWEQSGVSHPSLVCFQYASHLVDRARFRSPYPDFQWRGDLFVMHQTRRYCFAAMDGHRLDGLGDVGISEVSEAFLNTEVSETFFNNKTSRAFRSPMSTFPLIRMASSNPLTFRMKRLLHGKTSPIILDAAGVR